MSAFNVEKITHVHHWNDTLFSFKTTRDTALRFKNGQFVMIGLEVEGADGRVKPLVRAYSIASPAWDEEIEFLSIKVQDGPLTSKLQLIQPGDQQAGEADEADDLADSDLPRAQQQGPDDQQ